MALRVSPTLLRHAMNLWPPFRSAGIRVTAIARDWSTATVELRDRFFNRNFHWHAFRRQPVRDDRSLAT